MPLTLADISSWARVHPRLGSPFNAQLCVGVIIALLGLIYLGSSTAFNAMMSSAVYGTYTMRFLKANARQHYKQPRISRSNSHQCSSPSSNHASWAILYESGDWYDSQHYLVSVVDLCDHLLLISISNARNRYVIFDHTKPRIGMPSVKH